MKSAFLTVAIALAVLLAALTPPTASWAATPEPVVATVVAIRGAVVARNAKQVERSLAMKSPIFQDDVLKTGSAGRLQLMFTDNSIISLGSGSEMKIAEYRWQPGQKDGALKTQIKEGTFRVMGGALTKDAPQNFKTETPTATIGIRGSMYAGVVTPTTLSVVFQGGKGIEITNPFGTVSITKPGFGTHVTLNAAPPPPVKFTEKELGDLNKQLNGAAPAGEKKGDAATTTQQTTAGTQETQPATGTTPSPTTETTSVAATEPLPAPPPPAPMPVLAPLAATTVIEPVALGLPASNELPSAPNFTTPPSPPGDGIYMFSGTLNGVSSGSYGSETITGDVYMAINWHNNTILGAVFDPVNSSSQKDSPVFFFGHANGSSVNDIQVFGFGEGGPGSDIAAIQGNGSGSFFGTAFDFFSFNATGASYLVKGNPQSTLDSWTVQGGTQQVVGGMVPVADKGTATWKGFVVGVSEDMTDPDINRRLFRNTNPDNFTLNINKDTGTFSGGITTVADENGSGTSIIGLEVGGNNGSAYIADKFLGALLGCAGNNCFGGTTPTGLKDYGNYLVVEDPEKQWSSYFTWGYWEAAYVDPTDTTQRHIHVPYSMWLAGKPTTTQPATSFNGTYSGNVRGTKLVGAGASATASSINGSFSLPVDFSNNSLGAGTISLSDGYAINTAATGAGAFSFGAGGNAFAAAISGTGTAGTINGSFYGSNAEAVGGNFSTTGASLKYSGIFGGNR